MKICIRDECENKVVSSERTAKYCSKSCAAQVNNRLYPKRGTGEIRLCLRCEVPLAYHQEKFCGRVCAGAYRAETNIANWLSGKTDGSGKNGSMCSFVRYYMLEQANYRCSSPTCSVPGGWSVPNPVVGKPILTVDHIDGDWKNNHVDNLIVLCYNCHTLTPTFGSLNSGSKSSSRPNPEARRR